MPTTKKKSPTKMIQSKIKMIQSKIKIANLRVLNDQSPTNMTKRQSLPRMSDFHVFFLSSVSLTSL
jgi:hypothetical protein